MRMAGRPTVCWRRPLAAGAKAPLSIDLRIRPLFHWLTPRVRAHVFLCLLAYHVEWHLRRALAPLLYEDDDWAAGEALRDSVVRAAQRSPAAVSKQTRGITADGLRRGQARRARAAAAFSWPSLILSRIRGEAHPRSGPACSPSAAPAPSSPALPTT